MAVSLSVSHRLLHVDGAALANERLLEVASLNLGLGVHNCLRLVQESWLPGTSATGVQRSDSQWYSANEDLGIESVSDHVQTCNSRARVHGTQVWQPVDSCSPRLLWWRIDMHIQCNSSSSTEWRIWCNATDTSSCHSRQRHADKIGCDKNETIKP